MADRVASEHIAWRRSRGASWDDIGREARLALRSAGLRDQEFDHQFEIERAFAAAWVAIMTELIER